MIKAGIDQDALIDMFAQSTAKQGEALRAGVRDAVVRALQGREMTLSHIKTVLATVTSAATAGAAKNAGSPVDVEAMLGQAVAGMDEALLQAVEAHRKALQQFVDQGATLREKQLKGALASIESMEDTLFSTVTKAVQGLGTPMQGLQGPWDHVLSAVKANGTGTGAQAAQTVEQLMAQTQTAMRETRAASTKAAQAMLDGYAALVSGVLIGMSEGFGASTSASAPAARSKKR